MYLCIHFHFILLIYKLCFLYLCPFNMHRNLFDALYFIWISVKHFASSSHPWIVRLYINKVWSAKANTQWLCLQGLHVCEFYEKHYRWKPVDCTLGLGLSNKMGIFLSFFGQKEKQQLCFSSFIGWGEGGKMNSYCTRRDAAGLESIQRG